MISKTVLISIHPHHVDKILSGEKRLEFRRVWAVRPVERLLIYATAPKRRLVAVVGVGRTIVGSPTCLWKHARNGGGISRRRLFEYLKGKHSAIALELDTVNPIDILPSVIFSAGFKAPQSFRYLNTRQESRLVQLSHK